MQAKRSFGVTPFRCSRRVLRDRTAVYHVVNRTVRKHFWLDDAAKEMFRRMMRKQAAFAGVELLAYCMMNNHFHLLLRVPEHPLKEEGSHLLSDAVLLERYAAFYGRDPSVAEFQAALEEGGEVAEYARCRVLARMGDLSVFMRELKQRFAYWFNDRHGNRGTIWSERFQSVPVENTAAVLTQVAAYIDLNPVRAELVNDPKDYRWSGYGAAMRGGDLARESLCGLFPDAKPGWAEAVRMYRMLLYCQGSAVRGTTQKTQGRIDPKAVSRVIEAGGRVSAAEALHCRVREFSEAAVLGGDAFVALCRERWTRNGATWRKRWEGWRRFKDRLSEED